MTSYRGRTLLALAAVTAVASADAAPAMSASPPWLSKRDARRAALAATAATCRQIVWCRGVDVVAAERCRRASRKKVWCAIVFITADQRRCGGVVGVTKTRRGRLDKVMAVPFDCSRAQAAEVPAGLS
jgi:hypothetical protein